MFRLLSTERVVIAELDGKTIGKGVTGIGFSYDTENKGKGIELNLSVDLRTFEFMPNGYFDEFEEKLSEAEKEEKQK